VSESIYIRRLKARVTRRAITTHISKWP